MRGLAAGGARHPAVEEAGGGGEDEDRVIHSHGRVVVAAAGATEADGFASVAAETVLGHRVWGAVAASDEARADHRGPYWVVLCGFEEGFAREVEASLSVSQPLSRIVVIGGGTDGIVAGYEAAVHRTLELLQAIVQEKSKDEVLVAQEAQIQSPKQAPRVRRRSFLNLECRCLVFVTVCKRWRSN